MINGFNALVFDNTLIVFDIAEEFSMASANGMVSKKDNKVVNACSLEASK
jgi:hypothetical protein